MNTLAVAPAPASTGPSRGAARPGGAKSDGDGFASKLESFLSDGPATKTADPQGNAVDAAIGTASGHQTGDQTGDQTGTDSKAGSGVEGEAAAPGVEDLVGGLGLPAGAAPAPTDLVPGDLVPDATGPTGPGNPHAAGPNGQAAAGPVVALGATPTGITAGAAVGAAVGATEPAAAAAAATSGVVTGPVGTEGAAAAAGAAGAAADAKTATAAGLAGTAPPEAAEPTDLLARPGVTGTNPDTDPQATAAARTTGTATEPPKATSTSTSAPETAGLPVSVDGPSSTARGTLSEPAAAPMPREVPVPAQLARQVAVLRGAADGNYTMTVQLTPEELGPVQVSVTVIDGAVELTLRGAHEHGRAALTQALPDLRRDIQGAGLQCGRIDIAADTDQPSWFTSQQDAGRGREGHQGPDRRARSWMSSGDNDTTHPVTVGDQTRPTGLDVRM